MRGPSSFEQARVAPRLALMLSDRVLANEHFEFQDGIRVAGRVFPVPVALIRRSSSPLRLAPGTTCLAVQTSVPISHAHPAHF